VLTLSIQWQRWMYRKTEFSVLDDGNDRAAILGRKERALISEEFDFCVSADDLHRT